MRLIDADALKKAMDGYWGTCQRIRKPRNGETAVFLDVRATVEKQPTIDAETVRHGKWIPCAKSGLILTEQMRKEGIRWYGFKCSACNFVRKGNAPRDANYCECCGARMDEE